MKIKPSSKPFNFSLGDRGEVIAAAYLSEKGYKILDQKLRLIFFGNNIELAKSKP